MQVQNQHEELRLVAEENLTSTHAIVLRHVMQNGLKQTQAPNVVLDLTHIHEIDSMGMQLIIGLFKSCKEQAKTFRLEVASPHIQSVFRLCKLNTLFTVSEVFPHGV